MVLAIIGSSCVGKSIVAKEVAAKLSIPVRHCGEVIKSRAKELGINLAELSLDEHKAIDAATYNFALTSSNVIIEGTFLDCVLHDLPKVFVVRLICDKSERELRFVRRSNDQLHSSLLQNRDNADSLLRQSLYGTTALENNFATIDTTNLSIEEVADRVIDLIKEQDT